MPATLELLFQNWMKLVVPLAILGGTLVLGYAGKRAMVAGLRRWARRSSSPAPATVIEALQGPFMLWVLILGLVLATYGSELPPRAVHWISRLLLVLWVLSFTIMGTRLAGNLIKRFGSNVAEVMPVTTLTQTLAQIAVVVLAVLILLNQLGISITPILTALGVGGLAVALALQDTLSNLFAGFYVAVAGQVRVGDYIRLDTGQEGYVTDITWRSTAVRALANNLIIVPNSKLAQAIVTNYHFPEKRMAISINVAVGYEADPDQIERLLLEEARAAVGEVAGLLGEPEASVRLIPGFGESSLVFSLNVHVAEFVDQYLVQHELRKRILRRLRAEGVAFPPPSRVVEVRGAAASGSESA
jgi:small-conductance mechanosensitive channel